MCDLWNLIKKRQEFSSPSSSTDKMLAFKKRVSSPVTSGYTVIQEKATLSKGKLNTMVI